jgi:hypothetical protein
MSYLLSQICHDLNCVMCDLSHSLKHLIVSLNHYHDNHLYPLDKDHFVELLQKFIYEVRDTDGQPFCWKTMQKIVKGLQDGLKDTCKILSLFWNVFWVMNMISFSTSSARSKAWLKIPCVSYPSILTTANFKCIEASVYNYSNQHLPRVIFGFVIASRMAPCFWGFLSGCSPE